MESGLSQEEQLSKAREERLNIVKRYDKGRDEGALIDAWEDPNYELYHKTDRYGFIHDSRLPDAKSKLNVKRLEAEISRSQKWAKMIKDWDKYDGTEKLVKRLYKGVPLSVRGAVWSKLLKLEMAKAEQKGKYEEMKNIGRKWSTDVRQIDLDVNRTYRDHEFFRLRYDIRQQQLFHVLVAYSMYNQEIGYCQGMSQVAALLLIYLNEEEDAFWALSALMTDHKYSMHGFFIPGFPKLLRFQQHHDKILIKFLPKLKKHMEKNYVDSGLYTLKWFFQCFLDRVPFSLALRIWDIYLLEGEQILYCAAFTILKLHRRQIMRLDMDQILEYIQKVLEANFGYDDDYAVESLEKCMEELRRAKLYKPDPADQGELPQKPFGLFVEPTIEKEVGLRGSPSDQERRITRDMVERQDSLALKNEQLSVAKSNTSLDKSVDDVSSVGVGINGSRVSLANTSLTSAADLSTLSRRFDSDSLQSGRSLVSSDARSVQSIRSPRSPTEHRYRSGPMITSSHSGTSSYSHGLSSSNYEGSPKKTSSSSCRDLDRLSGKEIGLGGVKSDRDSALSSASEEAQKSKSSPTPPDSPALLHRYNPRPSQLSVSQSTLREIDSFVSEPVTPKASETPDTVRIFVPYTSNSENSYHSASETLSTQSSITSPVMSTQMNPYSPLENIISTKLGPISPEFNSNYYSKSTSPNEVWNGKEQQFLFNSSTQFYNSDYDNRSSQYIKKTTQNGSINYISSDILDPNKIKIRIDAISNVEITGVSPTSPRQKLPPPYPPRNYTSTHHKPPSPSPNPIPILYNPPSPLFHSPSPVNNPVSPIYNPPSPLFHPPSPLFHSPSPVNNPVSPLFNPPSPLFNPPSPLHKPPSPFFNTPSLHKPSSPHRSAPPPPHRNSPSPHLASPLYKPTSPHRPAPSPPSKPLSPPIDYPIEPHTSFYNPKPTIFFPPTGKSVRVDSSELNDGLV